MGTFMIKDVRIFTGEDVIPRGDIFVKDGLIEAVGNNVESVAGEIAVIDGAGKTVVPGLIDAHIHADKGRVLALEQSLRFGVTTVLDMHNEPHNVAKLKKIARERKDVADFKSACFGATIDHGWPAPVVLSADSSEETLAEIATWPKLKTPEDIEAYVEQNIKDGADYIKLMQESGKAMGKDLTHASLELQTAVVKAAHSRGLLAVAHATCYDDTMVVLRAGVDGTTHTFIDKPPAPEIVEAYKANNAWCNPTLAAMGSLTGDSAPITTAFANDDRVSSMLGAEAKQNFCRCMHFAAETSKVEYAYESVRQLKAAGIDILCGTDAAGPCLGTAFGASIHHELFLLVDKCGFSPLEALRSATGVTSRRFQLNDRGMIAPGRKADLVLVTGNPLDSIGDLLNLEGIWRDGVMLKKYYVT